MAVTATTPLARAIKAARRAHTPPLTQADLAGRLGVSPTAVSAWELGNKPPIDVAAEIEAALGLEPGYLTRHLGYVPADLPPDAITRLHVSVPEAIERDPLLNEHRKRVLLAVYEDMTTRDERLGKH